jgi:hypothetical protein
MFARFKKIISNIDHKLVQFNHLKGQRKEFLILLT